MPLSIYLTDTFNRGTTTAVSGANSTGGVGNGWIDRLGGDWFLSSNVLTTTNSGGNFLTEWLVRPSSENATSQRIVATFSAGANAVPIVLLRVNSSSNNAYAAYYDFAGNLTIAKFIGAAQTILHATSSAFTFSSSASYILDFTAVPNVSAGTDLTVTLYNAAAPSTALATFTVTGDTTAALQSAGSYGIAGQAFPGSTSAVLYTGGISLNVSPTSGSAVDTSTTLSITPTLSGSSAALTAAVSGGGTISTASPTSGVAFTYTPPATGSGTATVTVTDATDSLTATCTVTYAPAGSSPAFTCSPATFPLGVATAFTLTGSNTAWTSTTKPTVTGGTNAFISNIVVSGQAITGTLVPGTAAGTLTLHDTTDSATATVTAATVITGNAVWHGDSLTCGQNGTNAGTTSATRLAAVLGGLGPAWQGSNNGNPGHTLTQMIGELSSVNTLYDGTKANNFLIVQGGHNDIGQGANAATTISRIQTYLATALAAHPWKIVWSTEPPAQYPGVYPATFDSIRDAVNVYMRANWRSLGIAVLSDFAEDYRMGLDGCEYNSTYYSSGDLTHPTDAGYAIWGQYDLAAIQLSLGAGSLKGGGAASYAFVC